MWIGLKTHCNGWGFSPRAKKSRPLTLWRFLVFELLQQNAVHVTLAPQHQCGWGKILLTRGCLLLTFTCSSENTCGGQPNLPRVIISTTPQKNKVKLPGIRYYLPWHTWNTAQSYFVLEQTAQYPGLFLGCCCAALGERETFSLTQVRQHYAWSWNRLWTSCM